MREMIIIMLMASIVVGVLCLAVYGYSECTGQGGTFVRGIMWFTCVK